MWEKYRFIVSSLVRLLAGVAALGILTMLGVTCCDVLLRNFGHPVPGTVDIVQISACVTAVCALPYTTAVKGHVAVEFFFRKLPDGIKPWIDGVWRSAVLVMYAVTSWRSLIYGCTLLRRHSVTLTLQIPVFWVLWLMSFSFAVMTLVKLYNLAHPGKEMMRI